ncbi:MAG: phage/plasmid primase, P4 family [Geobacter sp.]
MQATEAFTNRTIFVKEIVPPTHRPPDREVPITPAESQQISMGDNQFITTVHDPNHLLGKRFSLNSDGTISKQAAVNLSFGIAVTHRVKTCAELAKLLQAVGNDPSAAIINAGFAGIEVGEEFLVLSEREIEERTSIPRTDREHQKGIHLVTHLGKNYKAVGRFKENVLPSCWQYLDRDVDQHTPEQWRELSVDVWKAQMAEIVPGLADVSCLVVGSTSARVLLDGQSVGGGNGHLWLQVADPADVERFRIALLVRAAEAGLTWLKPRYSRQEHGKIIGQSLTTIFDPSVLTPGRLTFYGRPVVSHGLAVQSLSITVLSGTLDRIDTAHVPLPDQKSIRSITQKAGALLDVTQKGNGLRITASDLTLDTELETADELLTVRQYVQHGRSDKVRCQTPFRASTSMAAFLSIGSENKPFVYDVGTSTTHWLSDTESSALRLLQAQTVAALALKQVVTDCGAPFEQQALQAFKVIQQREPATYQRLRVQLKKANVDVSVVQLDRLVKEQVVLMSEVEISPETHHGYAKDILSQLAVDGYHPVGHEGLLYVLRDKEKIWIPYQQEGLIRLVAEHHDGNSHCNRGADYASIAQHALMLATNDTFFDRAPVGIACRDSFYQILQNEILVEPLSPDHRQRVKIDIVPEDLPTPLFDTFLHETFQAQELQEEQLQIRLVQEIAGAVMTGCMHRFHKAALFSDPFGRAGKGTLERILRQLVPPSFVTAVSPFNWDKEYYLAALVGARLNVVGELPDGKPIPAAAFKTVTGGDLLTGRHPNYRPISFKNEAAHIFMSNHFITTSDHSEAFFARWLLVGFPNSRLRLGLPQDPGLADRIIEQEQPGIAHWALLGAQRLLAQRRFSSSLVQDRLMAQWRRTTNSLEEFIYECCERSPDYTIRRSLFYLSYKNWCTGNGRRPFAKGRVKELLEHNIGLGISHASLDGYEIFRGVQLQPLRVEDLSLD